MRNIKVIFSQADKELTEKLHNRSEKLADRYLALAFIFKIMTIILGIITCLLICTAGSRLSYNIVAVGVSLMSAIILFLISFIFQAIHYDYFVKSLHYQFMSEHMQEISEFEDSLTFSVSRTCSDTVTYDLPNGRCRHIETINNIPADDDVIITVKEDTNAKNRISLDWYAKTV